MVRFGPEPDASAFSQQLAVITLSPRLRVLITSAALPDWTVPAVLWWRLSDKLILHDILRTIRIS